MQPHAKVMFVVAISCRYRAQVEKVVSPKEVHILYIDYGNVSCTTREAIPAE